MGGAYRSHLAPAVLAACACLAGGAASAQSLVVERSGKPLAQVASTQLRVVPDAPRTQLSPQPVAGSLASQGPSTQLQPQAGPQTLLREAEVPRARLEQTRALLVELKAQPTPQQAISVDLPADVLFDFDKATLRPDAAGPLDKAAELIKSYPQAPITVVGHTDSKGNDAYNDALSLRRAETVAQALQQRTSRLPVARGLGEREPVAPNAKPDGRDDPQGRQQNRRVQILIGALSSGGAAAATPRN
ncbi:OmpA family protein [Acidovorax sp. FG27]|uniref:OmpA family protein n=1 Tax=Acidovorax sp. FG27 TaxID=3133652 RepID=UPI0030EAF5D7